MADVVRTTGEKITRHDNAITIAPQPMKTTIYHKQTGDPLEVYVVDAREILAQPDSLYTASKADLTPQQPTSVNETLGATTFGSGDRGRPLGAMSDTSQEAGAKPDQSKAGVAADKEDERSKDELRTAAEAKGIVVKSSATKADIARLLELDGKTKPELAEMAEKKGLDVTGTKADLVNRLADAD